MKLEIRYLSARFAITLRSRCVVLPVLPRWKDITIVHSSTVVRSYFDTKFSRLAAIVIFLNLIWFSRSTHFHFDRSNHFQLTAIATFLNSIWFNHPVVQIETYFLSSSIVSPQLWYFKVWFGLVIQLLESRSFRLGRKYKVNIPLVVIFHIDSFCSLNFPGLRQDACNWKSIF